MPWLKRRYEGSPRHRAAIQNRFEVLWAANGSPPEMLMVEQVHEPDVSTLWLRLPVRLVSAFPELEPAAETDLPVNARLLVGYPGQFEALFRYGDGQQTASRGYGQGAYGEGPYGGEQEGEGKPLEEEPPPGPEPDLSPAANIEGSGSALPGRARPGSFAPNANGNRTVSTTLTFPAEANADFRASFGLAAPFEDDEEDDHTDAVADDVTVALQGVDARAETGRAGSSVEPTIVPASGHAAGKVNVQAEGRATLGGLRGQGTLTVIGQIWTEAGLENTEPLNRAERELVQVKGLLEQVTAPIGRLNAVRDGMREGHFGHLARDAGAL